MLPATYQIPAAIVLLIGGTVACFFGYRLFRIVLAIFGFIVGAFASSSVFGVSDTGPMIVAAGNSARLAPIATSPLMPGITSSISVTSGRCARHCWIASRPLAASATRPLSGSTDRTLALPSRTHR